MSHQNPVCAVPIVIYPEDGYYHPLPYAHYYNVLLSIYRRVGPHHCLLYDCAACGAMGAAANYGHIRHQRDSVITDQHSGEFWEKASPGPGKSLSDCCIPDMSSPNTIPTICNGSISETRTQDFDLVDIG